MEDRSTFKHSSTLLTPTDGGSSKAKAKCSGGQHKSVSMTPNTHYMSDRHYVERKPLFAREHYPPILKMSHPQKLPEKNEPLKHQAQQESPRQTLVQESSALSLSDLSPPTASGEETISSSSIPELQTQLCHRKLTSGLTFHRRLDQRSFSNSVCHSSYTLHSQYPRLSHTHLRSRELGDGGVTKPGSSRVNSKQNLDRSYQRDYWTCAVPKALPPSPDRKSPAWNPNKEYEELLDYTYPLRPRHVNSEWNHSELQEDSLGKTDPNMQDSGIELDVLCSSGSLSGLELQETRERRTGTRSSLIGDPRLADLVEFPMSVDVPSCSTLVSLSKSLNSLDCNQARDGYEFQNHAGASSSTAVNNSTRVLPTSGRGSIEMDEEFWPLPENLEELWQLSTQVRELTAQLSPPVTASWPSLESETMSFSITRTCPQYSGAEEQTRGDQQYGYEGLQRTVPQTAAGDDRSTKTVRRSAGRAPDSEGEGLSLWGVRESLVKQLIDSTLYNSKKQSDSLIEHIQVFCSHLESLIQQLYVLSQSMDRITAPADDIVSLKSSLAAYQSFQKEVSSHPALTSCVLLAGQHLLSCINGNSSFLKDTLLLIEKQSGTLQHYSDLHLSSILSAMDSLAP